MQSTQNSAPGQQNRGHHEEDFSGSQYTHTGIGSISL